MKKEDGKGQRREEEYYSVFEEDEDGEDLNEKKKYKTDKVLVFGDRQGCAMAQLQRNT